MSVNVGEVYGKLTVLEDRKIIEFSEKEKER